MRKTKAIFLTGISIATVCYKVKTQNSDGFFEPPKPGGPTDVNIQKKKASFNTEASGNTASIIVEDFILEGHIETDEPQGSELVYKRKENKKSKQVFCIKSLVHLVKWVYLIGYQKIKVHKFGLATYMLKMYIYCRMRMNF